MKTSNHSDRRFLRRLWPNVCSAMASIQELDTNGDGLPDRDTRRNTYDRWNFVGTPSYIASLWVAALLAGVRVASELGETAQARKWRRILNKAVASFEKLLWNGEYYSLWVDGKTRDECCMTDQMSGEWFTNLVGLGHSLPRNRIEDALRAVFRHNFRRESGLVNASYPTGRRPRLGAYRNSQASSPWTGIEYATASMMVDFGMLSEARQVVRDVHNRYNRAGQFWKHLECGEHYYRAMSSWALLLAATGFKLDLPKLTVTIAPVIASGPFRAPWCSSTGWGQIVRDGNALYITCRSGSLRFRTLKVRLPGKARRSVQGSRKHAYAAGKEEGLSRLVFRRTVALGEGDALAVEFD